MYMAKLKPFDEYRFRQEFFANGNPTEQFIEKTCREVNFRISARTIQTRDQILEFIIESQTGVKSEIGTGIAYYDLETIEPHHDRRQRLFEFLSATWATREEALLAAESIYNDPAFYEFLFCKKLAHMRNVKKNLDAKNLLSKNPLWEKKKDKGEMENEFTLMIDLFENDSSFREEDFQSPAIRALVDIAKRWQLTIQKDLAEGFLQKMQEEIDQRLEVEADLPECFYSTLCDICKILELNSLEIVKGFYTELLVVLDGSIGGMNFGAIQIARGLEMQSQIPMPAKIKNLENQVSNLL